MAVGAKRSFLFLQGLATPFWVRLANAIAGRGHAVHRINLSGGDWLFWRRPGAINYRGKFADWREFLGGSLHDLGVTDIVLFGDCRPYHRVALDLARSRGIAVHIFEEGYFRPEWITVEKDGTNGYSGLPRGAAEFLSEAANTPPEEAPETVSGGISRRVRWELMNQAAMMLFAPLYPHYRRHRSHHPLVEMCGWVRRLSRRPLERRYTERLSRYLADTQPSYFLLPLQLESDYQIRSHSPFKSMVDVLEVVLESFAQKAPLDSLLLVKLHPLDNGRANFRKRAECIARRSGLGDRVKVMDGGHLPTLLTGSEGVVVVNSTTGLSALTHGRPVKVLGNAIFNVPGMTFQGSLGEFWHAKSPPDPELLAAFRRVVLARTQINGSFFTEAGLALAVDGVLKRMQLVPPAAAAAVPARSDLGGPSLAPAKSAILIH